MFDTPQEREALRRGISIFLFAAAGAGMPLVALVAAGQSPWWTLIVVPLFAGFSAFGKRGQEGVKDADRAERAERGDFSVVKPSDVGATPYVVAPASTRGPTLPPYS